jgi:tetratricopeptide (TPR) repeat protein
MYTRLGDQGLARQSAHRAIEEATRCNDRATLGKAHGLLALDYYWGGKSVQALEHGTQAEVLLAETAQHWWLGMAHFYVAVNHLLLGQFADCAAAANRARAVGETIGDPRLQCYAAFTIGWLAASLGERETALDACERSRKLSPDPVSRVYASGFLGLANVETGDAPAAIPLLESTVSELERFGFPQWHGMFMTLLGEAYRQRGEIERAVELAVRGMDITKRCRYSLGIGIGQRVLGAIAFARGALADAETAFTDALGTFASIDARFEIARSRLDLARVAFAQGHDEVARTHVREAHRTFVQAEAPAYVRRAEQLAAERGVPLR